MARRSSRKRTRIRRGRFSRCRGGRRTSSPVSESKERFEMGTHTDMNRRDALRVLGLAPLAASIGVKTETLERVTRAVARLEEGTATAAAPAFFNAHEWATVRV